MKFSCLGGLVVALSSIVLGESGCAVPYYYNDSQTGEQKVVYQPMNIGVIPPYGATPQQKLGAFMLGGLVNAANTSFVQNAQKQYPQQVPQNIQPTQQPIFLHPPSSQQPVQQPESPPPQRVQVPINVKASQPTVYRPKNGSFIPNQYIDYVVKVGDTPYKIAEKQYGRGELWTIVAEDNCNVATLTSKEINFRPGQTLKIRRIVNFP